MIKFLTRLSFVTMLLVSTSALAVDPVYTPFLSNKAIRGYDTVAYFTQGKAVKGDDAFEYEYQGATWLFSSAEHLAMFKAEPDKYAPQYGGYCAYAVAQNQTASIQPELFTIHDGKLYLNYSESVNQTWLKNKLEFIQQADKNWPVLLQE
jgi:YHS domain-containing protein